MPLQSQSFFNEYARAYESYEAEAVAEMYFLPAIIMSDDQKNVFTSYDDITAAVDQLMDKLQSVGVVLFEADVCQTMRLSENILFSHVKWVFSNEEEQALFTCFVSYTLQFENESLKIIVSVIDDEERELEKLIFPS